MATGYTMRISRLTVDKLGVKLYDKVSAVIAELISNSYDADADGITISAPMGQYLATKARGIRSDKGFEIKVEDDGSGMTPDGMQNFFLVVGAERRTDPRRGPTSLKYGRKVMGRKGVGKLAPFGICKIIEVLSAGGEKISKGVEGENNQGYLTSHIILDYDKIVAETDDLHEPYRPEIGNLNETLSNKTGTTIILRNFNYRRVPDIETLSRQIAQRFGIQSKNWKIALQDNTKTSDDPTYSRIISVFDVQKMPNTNISFISNGGKDRGEVVGPDGIPLTDIEAGFTYDEKFYPVEGWVAYSKDPYKDELMAGVRIYCRGKIAAQTSIFNRRAGFTGEYDIRSYLIGELHADWLDEDDDLIQTDRRDILWSDELGAAFQEWGQRVVQRIGKLTRDPTRKATLELFLTTGRVEERIHEVYPSEEEEEIRKKVLDLVKMFGRTISTAEAKNPERVSDLVDLSIGFAPHITLDEKMRAAAEQMDTPLDTLSALLRTARIAELSSFGRIAEDRIKVIRRLGTLKDQDDTEEDSLQNLIEDAPWLINPEWAPIIANKSLGSLREEFERFYQKETSETISLSDFQNPRKRPDFVLSSQEGLAQIIEIKRPDHSLTNREMDRIIIYHDCMESFLTDEANAEFGKFFRDFHVTLVCDKLALTGAQKAAFDGYKIKKKLTHINWKTFLLRTETVHKDFLEEAHRQRFLITTNQGE